MKVYTMSVLGIMLSILLLSGCTSSSEYQKHVADRSRNINPTVANIENECCYHKATPSCDFYKKVWPSTYYYQYYCASSSYYRGCKVEGCTRSDGYYYRPH